jgi:hypothetical protein
MLRYMMLDAQKQSNPKEKNAGEEPFIRALRIVRQRYEGKSISAHDLLRTFEEQLPKSAWYEGKNSLDWFYDSWINGTSIPQIGLQSLKFADKPGATAVSGIILQKSAPKELVTSVPIYAVQGKKNVFLGRIFADGPETSFHLNAPPGTRKVVVDPDNTLLARTR